MRTNYQRTRISKKAFLIQSPSKLQHPWYLRDYYCKNSEQMRTSNLMKFLRSCDIENTTHGFRGGSRIFSRGGGGFSKKFPKFWRPFFRSTKLIFRALPNHCFAPILAKFNPPQASFWKNNQISRFWVGRGSNAWGGERPHDTPSPRLPPPKFAPTWAGKKASSLDKGLYGLKNWEKKFYIQNLLSLYKNFQEVAVFL